MDPNSVTGHYNKIKEEYEVIGSLQTIHVAIGFGLRSFKYTTLNAVVDKKGYKLQASSYRLLGVNQTHTFIVES
jgi:hypothetical protein